MPDYSKITGRFFAHQEIDSFPVPLAGRVFFYPHTFAVADSTLYVPVQRIGYVVAGVLCEDSAGLTPGVSLLAPSLGVSPDAWTYRVELSLSDDRGASAHYEPFDITVKAGAEVSLPDVTPAPHPVTGEYFIRGEKGEPGAPGESITVSDVTPVIEEAVAPFLPSVARDYPAHGEITLVAGKSLHVLSLDGDTTLRFPTSGEPGQSAIVLVERGAQYLTAPGFTAPAGESGAWLTLVYKGDTWELVTSPTGGGGIDFTEAVEAYRATAPTTMLTPENFVGELVKAVGWVRDGLENYTDEQARMVRETGQIDPDSPVFSPFAVKGTYLWSTLFNDFFQILNDKTMLLSAMGGLKFLSENFAYEEWHAGYGLKTTPAKDFSGEMYGLTVTIGDAYEVVGIDEGSPKLRIKIRPFADGGIATEDWDKLANPHAGKIFEVPLTEVKE